VRTGGVKSYATVQRGWFPLGGRCVPSQHLPIGRCSRRNVAALQRSCIPAATAAGTGYQCADGDQFAGYRSFDECDRPASSVCDGVFARRLVNAADADDVTTVRSAVVACKRERYGSPVACVLCDRSASGYWPVEQHYAAVSAKVKLTVGSVDGKLPEIERCRISRRAAPALWYDRECHGLVRASGCDCCGAVSGDFDACGRFDTAHHSRGPRNNFGSACGTHEKRIAGNWVHAEHAEL
jgi:hypothetical protein